MKKIIVPKSLRKTVFIRILKKFMILLIGLWIADCFAEYVYLYTIEESRNMGNLSFSLVILYVIPFLISGIPLKLIDSDWYGEIILIEVVKPKRWDIDSFKKNEFALNALIKTQTGKLKSFRIIDEGEIFYGNRENVYKVGDKVLHIYGTNFITPVRKLDKHKPIVCVECGTKNEYGTKICRACGSSMEILLADTNERNKVNS